MVELLALPTLTRTCKGCGIEKPLSEFYPHKQSRDGRVRKCKSCYVEQRRAAKISTIEGRLREALSNAKETSQKKGRVCEVSVENLLTLWESQKGLCRYSGVPMTWDDSNRYTTVSLDRIDSTKGYVVDNIALCCTMVNIMKNQMPLEHFVWWCRSISNNSPASKAG
jgi:hypothetical protein